MIKAAACGGTGMRKRNIFVSRDVISVMLDDPDLCSKITKELDKRRRPPIARFRLARLEGVGIAAMDKLRFATISEEPNDDDDIEEEVDAAMADAAGADAEEVEAEISAAALEQQGLALLLLRLLEMYPNRKDRVRLQVLDTNSAAIALYSSKDKPSFWRSAATAIKDVTLDHIGLPKTTDDSTADEPIGEQPDALGREQAEATAGARFENDDEMPEDRDAARSASRTGSASKMSPAKERSTAESSTRSPGPPPTAAIAAPCASGSSPPSSCCPSSC